MKRLHLFAGSIASAAILILIFCSAASAGQLFIDDGVGVYSYLLTNPTAVQTTVSNTPGSKVIGMAFTSQDTLVNSPDVLLAAAETSGDIFAYSLTGAQTVFAAVMNPIGVGVDGVGNVYAGANGGTKIEEFSAVGVLTNTIATGVGVDSLAVDSAGDVFIANLAARKVDEYTAGGGLNVLASITDPLAGSTYGTVLDSSGDLFISYQEGTSGGIYELQAGANTLTSFLALTSGFTPVGLAIDGETGDLYASYTNGVNGSTGGVDVFTSSGGTLSNTPTPYATTNLAKPFGIAVLTPEPGTLLMLAAGLLAIALIQLGQARRQKLAASAARR